MSPIDYKIYPPDWKEIRERILKRANNQCEFCEVKNHVVGYRDADDDFISIHTKLKQEIYLKHGFNIIKIILTIAHLDHDEENHNVKDERLKALCQRCHLRYDVEEKKKRRHNKKAIKDLFED